MGIIKPIKKENREMKSFRLRVDLHDRLSEIAAETEQTKTHVLEELLSYAIQKYDEEKSGKN